MNILITGAFGFVGTNLSNAFKTSKRRSIAIDIAETDHHLFDEFYLWNELDKIEWDKVDTIIHLAGKAHDTKNTASRKVYFDINVGLTEKIFQYFLKSAATKFIFFSSVKAVADSVNGEQLTEEVLSNPQTPYGKSKLEAEKYILDELEKWREGEVEKVRKGEWENRREGEGERGREGERENRDNASERLHDFTTSRMNDFTNGGLNDFTTSRMNDFTNEGEHIEKKVYILRPCMIHGPGNKGNLNLLYKLVSKRIPWPLGSFDNKRSFCSIDNLMFIINELIENTEIPSGIYNVADDEPIGTNNIIEIISNNLSRNPRIWGIPKIIINNIAKAGDILRLPLNTERLNKLTETYIVSNIKIKKVINKQLPLSNIQGMMKTIQSFNKNI